MAGDRRGTHGKSRGGMILVALALLAAAFAFFWNNWSIVRVIEVSGVSDEEARAVAAASGVVSGMRLRDIDEESLSRALGARGEWEFLGVETRKPSTVLLLVRKREACALLHYAGNSVVLDDRGQVMQNVLADPALSLIEVRGMDIQSAEVGHELVTDDANQILAVSRVLRALGETGAYSLVSELNARNLDNLYMITPSGIKVELGDSENMAAKCEWMAGVLASLAKDGVTSGVVDVSTGNSATYRS